MVGGPNNLPDIKINPLAVPSISKRLPVDAALQADHKLVLAPDTVHLSPQAQTAVHVQSVVQAALQSTPEVRPDRVQDASAKISAVTKDSGAQNAQLAEKLLTEN